MPICNGIVEGREGKSIWINGERYSAYAEASIHVDMGDEVQFVYVEKPATTARGTPIVYKNIRGSVYPKSVRSIEANSSDLTSVTPKVDSYTPPVVKPGDPGLHTQRCIIRQNALGAAVAATTSFGLFNVGEEDKLTKFPDYASRIVEIARIFEAYTSGDSDFAEVMKELDRTA